MPAKAPTWTQRFVVLLIVLVVGNAAVVLFDSPALVRGSVALGALLILLMELVIDKD